MARLYSNENFALLVVEELRRLGHDVVTSYESGRANQSIPDNEVLAYATEQKRILVTLDWDDFKRLHRDNSNHAGIIICTMDRNSVALAQRIHEALASTPDVANKLISITKPSQ